MPIDLRIRPIGRPKVSKDSKLGFQRIVRKYVVEGPKASKTGLEGTQTGDDVALFRPVGEPDDEFADHYLVNQQIEPGKTVDSAYLTREYAEIRNTWAAETVSESGSLKKISRQYAVLRTNTDSGLGYSDLAWENHPAQFDPATESKSNDPWDFLPSVIASTEPTTVSYSDAPADGSIYDSANTPPLGLVGVQLNEVDLGTILTGAEIALKWVRATAKVDTSNPGVDLWSVSWAAPVYPFWSAGTGKKSSTALPTLIGFDENGITKFTFGSEGGAQYAHTYTFFTVGGSALPPALNAFIPSNLQSSVSMDFHILGVDGNHRTASFRQTFSNAIWKLDTTDGIKFPSSEDTTQPRGDGTYGPSKIAVSDGQPRKEVFDYSGGSLPHFPMYQNHRIQQTGGHISWTSKMSATNAVLSSTKIVPVFSHGAERIWKISLTYIS